MIHSRKAKIQRGISNAMEIFVCNAHLLRLAPTPRIRGRERAMKIMQPLSRKPGKLLATIVIFFAHLSVHAAECESWTAKLVSVQGVVESRAASASSWRTAGLNDTFCPGDSVRTGTHSRAAVVLPDHAVLRLAPPSPWERFPKASRPGSNCWRESSTSSPGFPARWMCGPLSSTLASRGRSSLSR
jgi:hypothetical protein